MKKRILIVDDDFMIRELLKFKLLRCGFEVITAGNEKEFWQKAFQKKPDLIILDILLKNKSGPSVYQSLVDFVGFDAGIPVVFISGLLSKEEVASKKFGNFNYALLSKPFNFEELVTEVDRLLNQNTSIDSNARNRIRNSVFALGLFFLLLAPYVPNSSSQEISGSSAWFFSRRPTASPSTEERIKVRRDPRGTIRGVAAWYSKSDPKIRPYTANGEIFDDSKYTCAVWGIPFGTRLKVTNLKNGKSVICRVNDRGPAKRLGRQIDVSKAAFRKIASPRQGVVKVSIQRLK